MSFLGKVFGKGKKNEKGPSTENALTKISDTEELLVKKQHFLEAKIKAELDIARKNATKNKRAALQALKRKKRWETQLDQVINTLTTIETQKDALENAKANTEVLNVMGLASKALKKEHNKLDIDNVHDLMDDISEQQMLADEINTAFSRTVGSDVDEDDLMKELEELEQEDLDRELLNLELSPTTSKKEQELPELPSIPNKPVPAPRKASAQKAPEEDEDLKELASWAT